jgi:3-hydroxyisobutyrate dehydrogenase-like beta-hydroxyacid dehydrogenase
VAGCGAMGLPMARSLLTAGFDVWGFDVRPHEEFGDFRPRMIADPADFAARCPTVISVVRDIPQTLDLCFDEQALFARDTRPRRLVVSSTVSPRFLGELAGKLPAGTELIDAPMSGAPVAAREARLTFMVGGAETMVDELMPIFRAMGREVHYLGPLGAGMTVKVVNNFVAASSVVAVRHAMAAAEALGVAPELLTRVMSQSSGGTWYGDNFAAIDWAAEGYDPENTIGILKKDVKSFLDALTGLPDFDNGEQAEQVIANLRKLLPIP